MADKLFTYIRLSLELVKLSILSAMEYRIAFIVQIVGMILNDAAHLAIWIIFFSRFNEIQGWAANDMFLLFSIFFVSFGLFAFFAGGAIEMAKYISRGQMDYFLALPKNPMWHITSIYTEIPAMGDIILGITLFLFFTGPLSLEKILVYALVVTFSSLIIYNFAVVTQSLAFFFGNYDESAERWIWILFGVVIYPQSVFTGWLKVIMLTILPAYFVVAVPVSLLKHFDWGVFGSLFGFWLITLLLALFIFKRGLRRYESGNLLDPRL